MRNITVRLRKPGKGTTVVYQGELLRDDGEHMLLHARWDRARLDLGYVVFEPGDHFYEHYYTGRWFTIFEVRDAAGRLKGWYCNVARPAAIDGATIASEDLELDLFVAPDRRTILRLDLDEFAARGLDASDPDAHTAALSALDALEQLARAGAPPFDSAP